METSMLKTLACKYGSSVSKMAARYKAKIAHRTGHAPAYRSASNAKAGNR
jgi:hypothetical protein